MLAALQLGWELFKPEMNMRNVIISLEILFILCVNEGGGGGMSLMKNDL